MRFTSAGTSTRRPVSSVTILPTALFTALCPLICAPQNRSAPMPTAAEIRRRHILRNRNPSSEFGQQKSLANGARLVATPSLAKSVSFYRYGDVPDFRLVVGADHSGGTVADFHGLPICPCQLNCSPGVYAAPASESNNCPCPVLLGQTSSGPPRSKQFSSEFHRFALSSIQDFVVLLCAKVCLTLSRSTTGRLLTQNFIIT